MGRVLREVKPGRVYAYLVESVNGRRVQRYLGAAEPAEVATWQEGRSTRAKPCCEGATGAQSERVGIYDPVDTTATGDVVGLGYWRDGQAPGDFMAEIVALYTKRTGRPPALAICHPGQVAELEGCGLQVRAARVNVRCVILTGVSIDAQS